MKILFWQNTISRHQKDLLEELVTQGHDVEVVIESKVHTTREAIGWNHIVYEDIKTHKVEEFLKYKSLNHLLKKYDCHIFSSISSYKNLYKGFKKCINLNLNIYIYSENKDLRGIKGKLRLIVSKIEYYKYYKKINGIFAVGEKGKEYFQRVGYSNNIVNIFGYYINSHKEFKQHINTTPKFVFIGDLTKNKGFHILLEVLKKLEENDNQIHIDIFGTGPMKKNIEKLSVDSNESISYKGVIKNDLIVSKMSQYDYLVLPSLYDGWGVVVNEALIHGCNVITTNEVGSSYLLKDYSNSYVLDVKNLEKQMLLLLSKLKPLTLDNRLLTIDKSKKSISPSVAAKYLINEIKRLNR